MSDPDFLDEDFLDCTATVRRFRLQVLPTGATPFMQAMELKHGEPTGQRFLVKFREDEPPPWGELRAKVRRRLAERDVVRDASGALAILTDRLRGQVRDSDDEAAPAVLVDGIEVSWSDLGRLVSTYAGWTIRIEFGGDD